MSEKETIKLSKNELKYLLIDSLNEYSEDVAYISGTNPYKFSVNKQVLYIFIHNVHESGKGRGNQDECRIQINRTKNFLEAKLSGRPVLFFGYFADYNVFTAWNPHLLNDRINEKGVVSVYSRFSVQREAFKVGMSCYRDTNEQTIVTFKPEYLGLYLENYDAIHTSRKGGLLKLIRASDTIEPTEDATGKKLKIEKKIFTVTHRRFKRDARFREIIVATYQSRCAICGIQLNLVEAAHIVPHSHAKGTDDPTNGICLCVLHHKAYDNALIYIDDSYQIKINDLKIEYLEKIHKDGGITKFSKLQFDKLMLPSSKLYYPSKDSIKIANSIRGIV